MIGQFSKPSPKHLFLMVGIRDLWLADSRGLLNQKEKATLNTILDQLEDDLVPSAEHQSLTFSFCPTKNRRVFKLISHLEEMSEIDPLLLQSVAQMKIEFYEDDGDIDEVLYAVWVDPRDLSYHNFEFILPLDRALKRKTKSENESLDFNVTGVKSLDDTIQIVRGKLEGADTDLLLQLDKLGLYQKPANSSTRGGERFVFSSSALSDGLTKAIKESKLLKKLCRGVHKSFQFVNYVFRCNRFTPSDAKFDMHLDTPYYDPARNHISLYTMIIYLSSGSGKSILKVLDNNKENRKKVSVKKVDTLEFIIFNQQYEHEGRPFIDNDKIFLRTELIFSYDPQKLVHKPEVSKIFSSAIYMTLESSFQPELSKYAHQLYEKVNAVHWGLTQESDPPVVLQKCWADQIPFATNGSDYWFPLIQQKSNDASDASKLLSTPLSFIKLAAMIATLDYTNASLKSDNHEQKSKKKKKKTTNPHELFQHFRSNCQVKEISRPSDEPEKVNSDDWILKHLWTAVNDKRTIKPECEAKLPIVLTNGDEAVEIMDKELIDYKDDDDEEKSEENSNSESFCCPFHCNDGNFEPHKNEDVQEAYDEIIEFGNERLYRAPVFIYNQQIHMNPENITVENDKIFVGCGSNSLPAVNFACK